MSRRALPLCAVCGNSLERSARVLVEWTAIKYMPQVGWHPVCRKEEPLGAVLLEHGDPTKIIEKIEKRGWGRVTRNRYQRHSDM